MPEITAPAGAASASTGSQPITTGNQGGSASGSATAEPRIGWAGESTEEQHGAETNVETGAEGTEDALDADGFGDDSFEEDGTGQETTEFKETSFKDLFEQLKSQDPKIAKAAEKALKRDYFENRRYKQIPGFETPEKAREVADKLVSLGGIEGIEKETGEAATMWNMLGAGDPALLDSLESDYGEGLAKLAPHMLDRFLKLDPQGWAHNMASVFMATMNSAPAGGISALAAFNALAQKFPEVQKSPEFQRIAEVVNGVADVAAKAPQKPAATDDKVKKRELELRQKENVLYQREVAAKIAPLQKAAAQNALNVAVKGRKLSNEARQSLIADIVGTKENPVGEFARLLQKDAKFQENAKKLLSANDTDGFVKLYKAAQERTMQLAARNIWRKYYGISGLSDTEKKQRTQEAGARTEAGGGGATTGTIKTATPNASEVDWSRMRAEFGREKAEDMFLWDRKYFKKGDKKNTFSY